MKLVKTVILASGCLFAASVTQFEAAADAPLAAAPAEARKAFHLGDDNYLCLFPCWWGKCCEEVANEEDEEAA